MELPDNKKLFTAWMGLIGLGSLATFLIWCFNQPSDCLVLTGIVFTYAWFVFSRRYVNYIRRILN